MAFNLRSTITGVAAATAAPSQNEKVRVDFFKQQRKRAEEAQAAQAASAARAAEEEQRPILEARSAMGRSADLAAATALARADRSELTPDALPEGDTNLGRGTLSEGSNKPAKRRNRFNMGTAAVGVNI